MQHSLIPTKCGRHLSSALNTRKAWREFHINKATASWSFVNISQRYWFGSLFGYCHSRQCDIKSNEMRRQQYECLVQPASLLTLDVCVSRRKWIVPAWSVYVTAGIARRWEAGTVSAQQSIYTRPRSLFSINMSAFVINTPAYMWQPTEIQLYPAYSMTGRRLRLPMLWPMQNNFYY